MPIRRRKLESYEGDPLIPILNLVCMLIPLLLYGAVFIRFMTLTVNAPKINRAPAQQQPQEQAAAPREPEPEAGKLDAQVGERLQLSASDLQQSGEGERLQDERLRPEHLQLVSPHPRLIRMENETPAELMEQEMARHRG